MGGEDVEMTAAPIVFKKKKPSRRAPKPGKKKRQQFQSEDPRVSAQEPELETEGPAWTSLSHTALGRPVLFTPDGRFALVATGAAVKIYQADTCTLLSSLVPPSIAESSSPELFRKLFPRNSITALRFHPLNSMQLITASLDGFVRIWDYINGFLIKSLFVDASIVALASSSFQPEHLFLATAGQLALNKTKRSHRIATSKSFARHVSVGHCSLGTLQMGNTTRALCASL